MVNGQPKVDLCRAGIERARRPAFQGWAGEMSALPGGLGERNPEDASKVLNTSRSGHLCLGVQWIKPKFAIMREGFRTTATVALASLWVGLIPPVLAKDTEALRLARQLNKAFIEVADEVSPSVVVITVTQRMDPEEQLQRRQLRQFWRFVQPGEPEGEIDKTEKIPSRQGLGSGVIIREEGYILTNNHVVDGAEKITVRLKDGREFAAEVKGIYPDADVAVLKLKGDAKDLTVAHLGDSDKVRVGEFAIAIGAPFELDYSVTYGHVSAKGRGNLIDRGLQDFIQTDASINFGNSGGPLVNLDGEVIGINSMIRGVGTGIGFAIPSNLARSVSDRIISDGKFVPSWIGVKLAPLDGDRGLKEAMEGVTEGAMVASIRAEGPASKSKLEPGDVIVKIDGTAVKSVDQVRSEIARKSPGKEVSLEVIREGKHQQVAVTPQVMPENALAMMRSSQPLSPATTPAADGLTLKTINAELARESGLTVNSGVLVTDVDEKSLGARLGFQAGDVITEVNGEPVTSVKQLRQALKSNKATGARLKIIRDGAREFLLYRNRTE